MNITSWQTSCNDELGIMTCFSAENISGEANKPAASATALFRVTRICTSRGHVVKNTRIALWDILPWPQVAQGLICIQWINPYPADSVDKDLSGTGQEFQMNVFKLSISLPLSFQWHFSLFIKLSKSNIVDSSSDQFVRSSFLLIYNTPLLTYSTSGLPETGPAYILRTNEEAPITGRHMCNKWVTPVHFASKGFKFLSWRAFIIAGGM